MAPAAASAALEVSLARAGGRVTGSELATLVEVRRRSNAKLRSRHESDELLGVYLHAAEPLLDLLGRACDAERVQG